MLYYSGGQYSAVRCITVEDSTVQYVVLQWGTVQCSTLYNSGGQYGAVRCITVGDSTVQYVV